MSDQRLRVNVIHTVGFLHGMAHRLRVISEDPTLRFDFTRLIDLAAKDCREQAETLERALYEKAEAESSGRGASEPIDVP